MNSSLELSILNTLAWFDLFSYPLTAQELHRYLWEPNTQHHFDDFLSRLDACEAVEKKNGFYFLPGRQEIIRSRQLATPIIDTKLRIARRACKKLRWIPFVRAVFVCNTVASATASAHSDIDVFIVIRKGRMWLTRFFITTTLSLFRMRRHGKCVANKICLSFFITDEALNLAPIRWGSPDIYLAYWLSQLMPIYDPMNMLRTIQQKNSWVRHHLPNAFTPFHMTNTYRVEDHACSRFIKNIGEKMWRGGYGNLIEQQAKQIQELKMKRNYDSVKDAGDSRVVIANHMLKFHENDRRAQYREQWQKKMQNAELRIQNEAI